MNTFEACEINDSWDRSEQLNDLINDHMGYTDDVHYLFNTAKDELIVVGTKWPIYIDKTVRFDIIYINFHEDEWQVRELRNVSPIDLFTELGWIRF